MADSEDTVAKDVKSKSKSKKEKVDSAPENGHGEETAAPIEGESIEVHYDPNAKPSKGILRKSGEDGHHKSEGHIHIEAADGLEHDAEKKKGPKKPMPVEGRSGVIVGGKTKRSISAPSAADRTMLAEKAAAKKEDPVAESSKPEKKKDKEKDKDGKKDKKDEDKKDKKDKKEKH